MTFDTLQSNYAVSTPVLEIQHDYWYAVQTFAGKEERVKRFLGDHFCGCGLLYPKRLLTIRKHAIVKTVQKPLFPGYFFVKTISPLGALQARNMIDTCAQMCSIPIKILGHGQQVGSVAHAYHAISQNEMRYVLFLIGQGELIGFSSYHKEGGKVRVVAGPLVGQEAIITRVNPRKNRITIQLTMFGAKHQIDVGGECLSNPEI